MTIVRLERIDSSALSKSDMIAVSFIGLVAGVVAFVLCWQLNILGTELTQLYSSSALVVITLVLSTFSYIKLRLDKLQIAQTDKYKLALNSLDKNVLVTLSKSQEITDEERELILSLLNDKYKGWSLS